MIRAISGMGSATVWVGSKIKEPLSDEGERLCFGAIPGLICHAARDETRGDPARYYKQSMRRAG